MNKPTDSVRIVVFDGQNPERFLVLTEADDPDNWKLPGGRFDSEDELPDTAAWRELEEELNLGKDDVELSSASTLTNDDGRSVRHIFSAVLNPEVQLKPVKKEIAQTDWATQETVPEGKNRNHILGAVASARSSLVASDK